jgi:hypothetical protein
MLLFSILFINPICIYIYINLPIKKKSWMLVHTCNPSCLKGWDQEDHSSRPGQIVCETPSPKPPEQNGMEVWFMQKSTCFASMKPWVQIPIPQKNKTKNTFSTITEQEIVINREGTADLQILWHPCREMCWTMGMTFSRPGGYFWCGGYGRASSLITSRAANHM